MNVTFASWNQGLKFLPVEFGGQVEPEVGAGQVYWKEGFGHAPMNGLLEQMKVIQPR